MSYFANSVGRVNTTQLNCYPSYYPVNSETKYQDFMKIHFLRPSRKFVRNESGDGREEASLFSSNLDAESSESLRTYKVSADRSSGAFQAPEIRVRDELKSESPLKLLTGPKSDYKEDRANRIDSNQVKSSVSSRPLTNKLDIKSKIKLYEQKDLENLRASMTSFSVTSRGSFACHRDSTTSSRTTSETQSVKVRELRSLFEKAVRN